MLAVIGLLSTTFGVSVASALLPLISVELFAIGLVLNGTDIPWWLLALVIAAGQIAGKLLHFYAARGAIRLPWLFRRKDGEREQKGRWREWLEKFRSNCQQRPVWTGAVLLISAAASLPPFAAIAVIAGWAKVPLAMFVVTGFIGRFVRFGALAIAPGVVVGWL
ncbi:VTT domain-containing protein [Saccharopolyspora sp. NPDC000995]